MASWTDRPTQLTLLGDTRDLRLTERQEYALLEIERADGGLASDELGAVMHERRGKHDRGVRCSFCQREGQGVAQELRKKGLLVRRRSGLWQSLRPLDSGAPIGAGASESSGPADSLLQEPDPTRDVSRRGGSRPARSTDDDLSFGEWVNSLP